MVEPHNASLSLLQDKRRAQVEKKLEQKERDEKDQLRQDRAALWGERRAKQKELRQLEHKMRIVKMVR